MSKKSPAKVMSSLKMNRLMLSNQSMKFGEGFGFASSKALKKEPKMMKGSLASGGHLVRKESLASSLYGEME